MNICEIPLTVSSLCLSFIWLALGAKRSANLRTLSGNVAEKRRIWTVFGRRLLGVSVIQSRTTHLLELYLPLDAETLVTQTLLVKHVVGLVNNKNLQLRGVELLALAKIHDGSRSSHDDAASNTRLARDGAGNGGLDNQVLAELTNGLNNGLDLAGKLSAGSKQKGLRLMGFGEVDARKNGKDESGSLSSTGLRLGNHVAGRVGEHQRQALLLDLGGLLEVDGEQATVDSLGETQLLEGADGVERALGVILKIAQLDLDFVLVLDQVALALLDGCLVLGGLGFFGRRGRRGRSLGSGSRSLVGLGDAAGEIGHYDVVCERAC